MELIFFEQRVLFRRHRPARARGLREEEDWQEDPAMNFHAMDDRLLTGGHVVGNGLDALAGHGVTVVIDLRDAPTEGQQRRLGARGIQWINIPVECKNPRPEDFAAFSEAMR
ncbi:MAG: hypothetical protein P8008_07495, partial [Gammaproteobacteria bacterium]